MPVNAEIKARVDDLEVLRRRVRSLGAVWKGSCVQEDTFFRGRLGRLKLRVAEKSAELIHYEREDREGPKSSHYEVCAISDPEGLRRVLAASLGVRGVVRKRRELFLLERTRIHLDEVEGLGSFLELEVMLGEGEAVEDGERTAVSILRRLTITENALVSGAYIDLLERGGQRAE